MSDWADEKASKVCAAIIQRQCYGDGGPVVDIAQALRDERERAARIAENWGIAFCEQDKIAEGPTGNGSGSIHNRAIANHSALKIATAIRKGV